MPRLGWQDQLLYWSAMILGFGGAVICPLFSVYYQEKLVSQNPDVIAHVGNGGVIYAFWLSGWLFVFGLVIATVFYQRRIPVFGRSDIQYGPPTYPRIYPFLRKNNPKYWQSPKKLAQKKIRNMILAIGVLISLLFSIAMYPHSLYGRFELLYDGSVVCFDSQNQESAHYRLNDMESVRLDVSSSGKRLRDRRWYAEIVFTFSDGKLCSYSVRSLGDDWTEAIRTAIELKVRYGNLVSIENADQLWQVIRDQKMTTAEKDLLYQLFKT